MGNSRDGLQKYTAAEISSMLSEVTVQIVHNVQRYNNGTKAHNIITARISGRFLSVGLMCYFGFIEIVISITGHVYNGTGLY
jgi:hypothetical protein